jgi:tetratricopeptide (TPR) repeat protein
MKKYFLYVFWVLLVILMILSCSPSKPPLASESASFLSEPMMTSVGPTPTLTIKDGLPIFPHSIRLLGYYDEFFLNSFVRFARYDEAIEVMDGEHVPEFSTFAYLDTCLEISLHGNAADVLPICEEAVEKFPAYEEPLFTRGIARSITGDYEGAISDLDDFLEIIEKTPEKKYNSKDFAFETDIHLIECNIREWLEALKTRQNPFTDQQIAIIPSFKRINTSYSYADFDDMLLEMEQLVLLDSKQYEAVFDSVHFYFEGNYPQDYNPESETDPEIRQQNQIIVSITTDLFAYSTVCLHGCFAGDIDHVYLYCERANQIYEFISEYIDTDDRYSYLRGLTLSKGVYLVYRGEFDEAKAFFEDYLAWQQSNDFTWHVCDETIEEWITKLDNNEYPFQQEFVVILLQTYPWR